ncbi:complement receptor type 1-like isoform 2-T2 [Odontesthes bonariensis]|uniref:complement receptor type 1-like isoform X2 n=1 Tax=Odontesthes bonariensis TaxID=219752 RepID=UPI003F5813C3
MRTAGGDILILSFALLASARAAKKCSTPLETPATALFKKVPSGQMFNSGEKVYFRCADEYTPSGGLRYVECKDGEWTRLTLKCDKKTCGNAGDISHGEFRYDGETYIGARAYATCKNGYTLRGKGYVTCQKSGWSGAYPTCEEGESKTTCSNPAVDNSLQKRGDVSVYQVGERMSFSCQQGFQLAGAAHITCGPDGQWQPLPPRCLQSPDRPTTQPGQPSGKHKARCGAPPAVGTSHANLADKYITKTSFSSGEKVYYTCDVGYLPAAGSKSRMCLNGEWTQLKLKCELKFCGQAGEIKNGQFVYTGIQFGDTATAICNEGYILVGKATRNCMSHDWDGRIPVCEAVDCPEPKVTTAQRTDSAESPYFYRSVVRYGCHVGNLDGPNEIWCTKNGTWNTSPPECTDITCPSPNVDNGLWIGAHRQKHSPMENLSIECRRGFTIRGPTSITCSSEGRWLPYLPQCQQSYYYSRG